MIDNHAIAAEIFRLLQATEEEEERVRRFTENARARDPLFDRRPGVSFDNQGLYDPWMEQGSLSIPPNQFCAAEDAEFYESMNPNRKIP